MDPITITRSDQIITRDIRIGDKMLIPLEEFGNFFATVHKVTGKGVLFIFDDYVDEQPMNWLPSNEGGFEKSELNKWLNTYLIKKFPAGLRNRIEHISIPSVGELFGRDEWCNEHFEPDTDEQLPLMKDRRNRVAYYSNVEAWGWLRNAIKKKYSMFGFARVGDNGSAYDHGSASTPIGVRPEFWLI